MMKISLCIHLLYFIFFFISNADFYQIIFLVFLIFSNTEAELRQNLCEVIPKKRRMVVRTPSRLYRFAGFDPGIVMGHASAGIPPILGPEFVVRSKEPMKVLTLLQDTQVML